MKSIFDKAARDNLTDRINSLHEHSMAQWGKMDVNQMLRHCIMWDEVTLGKRKVKQPFLSKLFGKLILMGFVKDETPLRRYLPAVDELKIKEPVDRDIASEKRRWISLIHEYPQISTQACEVPFFGEVTKEQAGCLAYKHADHHLRQFNV